MSARATHSQSPLLLLWCRRYMRCMFMNREQSPALCTCVVSEMVRRPIFYTTDITYVFPSASTTAVFQGARGVCKFICALLVDSYVCALKSCSTCTYIMIKNSRCPLRTILSLQLLNFSIFPYMKWKN